MNNSSTANIRKPNSEKLPILLYSGLASIILGVSIITYLEVVPSRFSGIRMTLTTNSETSTENNNQLASISDSSQNFSPNGGTNSTEFQLASKDLDTVYFVESKTPKTSKPQNSVNNNPKVDANPIARTEELNPLPKDKNESRTVSKEYHVIAGSFSVKSNAEILVKTLRNQGYSDAGIVGKFNNFYSVKYASYSSKEQAISVQNKINKAENSESWVKHYKLKN